MHYKVLFMKNKITYLIIALVLFAGLKLAFPYLSIDNIRFLLAPTNEAIKLLFGTNAIYSSASGYFHADLNIVINKSCSGFNFLLISFLMFSFILLKSNMMKSWQAVLLSLPIAYIITIVANVSRISGYLIMMQNPAINAQSQLLHKAEGIFVYLTLLIISYIFFNHIINKIQHKHEKVTQS